MTTLLIAIAIMLIPSGVRSVLKLIAANEIAREEYESKNWTVQEILEREG